MPSQLASLLILFPQAVICGGALAVTALLPDPGALKTPLMLLGMLGLLPMVAFRIRAGTHLLPGLLLFTYLYVRLTDAPGHHAAALALLACAAAFLLGITRVPLANARLLVPLILLCVGRGVLDLITLDPIGGDAPAGHAVTSFFLDKHIAGGVLVLGAFLHFHLMEKGGPRKPVQVLLYTSSFAVLLAMVLSDSRVAQGAFLACFLPLLFLTIRLDGHEPAPERLAWIAGITLCLGLAWINLPELHHRRVAEAFSPAEPGRAQAGWSAALGIVSDTPLAGSGVGGFRHASVDHLGAWVEPGRRGELPVLDHAHSHFLQVAAEGGAIALALEVFLLFIALSGMALVYFRAWRLQAKYGFFSLAALSLMGLFTPVLERAPLNIAYWALIGYGWSFALRAVPRWIMPHRGRSAAPRRRNRIVGAATVAVIVCLSGWHIFHHARELQSVRLFLQAQALSMTDPKKSTDKLVLSLAWDPRNVEANYSYARVLAFFNRTAEALKRVEHIQDFAPDWRREAEALGEIFGAMGRHQEAGAQATRLLGVYPHHLGALEAKAEALKSAGRCAALDTFRIAASRLGAVYPMPQSKDYTLQSLDSLFMANRDINFLQRWFAGRTLRQRFVERKMLAYNRGFQYHSRALLLGEARCPPPADTAAPPDDGADTPWHTPAGITPEGEPEPDGWETPKPRLGPPGGSKGKPAPAKKRRQKSRRGGALVLAPDAIPSFAMG